MRFNNNNFFKGSPPAPRRDLAASTIASTTPSAAAVAGEHESSMSRRWSRVRGVGLRAVVVASAAALREPNPSGVPQPPPYRGASRVVTNHLPRIPTLLRAWRRADRRIAVNAS